MVENIVRIGCLVVVIATLIGVIQIQKKEKQAAADRKARTKHIKRVYDGITVDITLTPMLGAIYNEEYWDCQFKCDFFTGDFSFKDFPSIEQQMEDKILPLAQSVGRWKYRLKEIEEIS